MDLKNNNSHIDFNAVFSILLGRKKYILISCTIFAILGVFYVLLRTPKFQTNVSFLYESSNEAMPSLGGLASLAGVNLGKGLGEEVILPSVYPNIAKSPVFIKEIITTEISFFKNDSFKTYQEIILSRSNGFSVNSLYENLKGVFNDSDLESAGDEILITGSDIDIIQIYLKNLNLEIDELSGLVTITFTDENNLLSFSMTNLIKDKIQNFILDARTRKSQMEYDFISQKLKVKEMEFEVLKDSLAEFKNNNQNINNNLVVADMEAMQYKVDVAFSVYDELSNQATLAEIKLNKTTPIFTTITEPYVAVKKVNMRGYIVCLIYVFCGFIFGILFSLFYKYNSLDIKWIK